MRPCHYAYDEVENVCLSFSAGDLLYLDVVTLEGVEHFITASPSGFFLNRSTARDIFDPTPKKTSHHSTHLVGLLSVVSGFYKLVMFVRSEILHGGKSDKFGREICLK